QALSQGMAVRGSYPCRVTRYSDLLLDETEVKNLGTALAGDPARRHFGESVPREVADNMPAGLDEFLLEQHQITAADLTRDARRRAARRSRASWRYARAATRKRTSIGGRSSRRSGRTWSTAWSGTRHTPRCRSWCAPKRAGCGATRMFPRATITPARRGSTRI